jgi:hypothetical protein
MKRPRVAERNDFVHHTLSADLRKEVQQHWGTRRKRCSQTGARWQKAAKAAAVDPRFQPPAERVRVIKAAFAIAGWAAKCQEMGVLPRLLFDSFEHPAVPGVRSATSHLRQLLFRAEPYQIDLQIELHQERNRFIVTGQLADLGDPEMFGHDVQITLSDRGENVVNVMTNQFGEFRAEVENSGDLQLSFLGRAGNPIIILLRGALGSSSEAQE